jgi:hypothetical protein
MKRLELVEEENTRLKKADLSFDKAILQDVLKIKV